MQKILRRKDLKRRKEEDDIPRIARLVVKGEPAVYHVISRTALDGFVLGDVEFAGLSYSMEKQR